MGFTVQGQESDATSLRPDSSDNGCISRTTTVVVTVLVSLAAVTFAPCMRRRAMDESQARHVPYRAATAEMLSDSVRR